jgi:hypothetical protein
LDGIFSGFPFSQHRKSQSISWIPQWIEEQSECRSVAAPGARHKIVAGHNDLDLIRTTP